jgi:uncharacterized protein YukE
VNGLAMPGGDPVILEQLAAQLEAAAAGAGNLGGTTRQVAASVRSGANWTGDAADAYTSFTGNLGQGVAAVEAPLARMASAVRAYAGYLRAAQQTVAAYASAADAAQVSGNDAGYVSLAAVARQYALTAVADWQAAGDQAASVVNAASGQLGDVFGQQGPVLSWPGRQSAPLTNLAGVPALGEFIGPEILKTPPGDPGPLILKTPPGDLGPQVLITLPGDMGPEILITPPGYSGPLILKTPPAESGPVVNYEQDPNPELPPGYTSSPGLLGDPYNPSAVSLRSELWRQWVVNENAKAAQNVIRMGQGPREITRIDRPDPNVPGSQWHAQGPGRGSPGLNMDGTPHDGDPELVRAGPGLAAAVWVECMTRIAVDEHYLRAFDDVLAENQIADPAVFLDVDWYDASLSILTTASLATCQACRSLRPIGYSSGVS